MNGDKDPREVLAEMRRKVAELPPDSMEETEDERHRREYHEARRAEVQEDIDRLAALGIPARAHWEDHITAWTGFVIVDPAHIYDALGEQRGEPYEESAVEDWDEVR